MIILPQNISLSIGLFWDDFPIIFYERDLDPLPKLSLIFPNFVYFAKLLTANKVLYVPVSITPNRIVEFFK